MVTQATSTALEATNIPISCALAGLYFVTKPPDGGKPQFGETMLKTPLVLCAMAAAAVSAQAQSVNMAQIGGPAFKSLVEDTGAMASYRAQLPSEPQGLTGFDLGFSLTQASLQQTSRYAVGTQGLRSTMRWASLHAHKGLPLGWDLGAFISQGMDGRAEPNGIDQRGVELRYALLEGSTATPALALRASATELSGIQGYQLKTQGMDLSVSKGFALFTPYAGFGVVRAKGQAGELSDSVTLNKTFLGIGTNLLLINLNLEYDKTGNVPSYSLKAGWRF
jgi:hypothetical protein